MAARGLLRSPGYSSHPLQPDRASAPARLVIAAISSGRRVSHYGYQGYRRMSDHDESAVEHIARELIDQHGADASWRARARADDEGNRGNFPAAVRWRLIADTIERLQNSSEAS